MQICLIDLRYDERSVLVHPERARIINDDRPAFDSLVSKRLRNASPALKSAMLTPSKLSGRASSTVYSSPLKVCFVPAERFEDNKVSLSSSKFLSSSVFNICCPTAPVAPTTATCNPLPNCKTPSTLIVVNDWLTMHFTFYFNIDVCRGD